MVSENVQKVSKMLSLSVSKEFYKFKCISLNEIGTTDDTNFNIIFEKSETKNSTKQRNRNGARYKKRLSGAISMPSIIDDSYAIVVLGELNVGKSALCRNFFRSGLDLSTSMQKNRFIVDDCEDDLFEEHTPNFANHHHIFERPIFVNGIGSRLRILDVNTEKQFLESKHGDVFSDLGKYLNIGDGYVVAYTCTDYCSFETAKKILKRIKEIQLICKRHFSVVLVGNKCDLVRKRQVTTKDGMRLAEKFDVKFIETSAVLNENTEKLFQGMVNQIRLREAIQESVDENSSSDTESVCSECNEEQRLLSNSLSAFLKTRCKEERKSLAVKCWRKINKTKENRKKRCLDFNVV